MNNENENRSIRRDLDRSFKPNTNIRLTTKTTTFMYGFKFRCLVLAMPPIALEKLIDCRPS